jgi:hypothetical protein
MLADAWKNKGYSPDVTPTTDEDGEPRFAVRIGHLPSEDLAVMLAQAFVEKEGKPARAVRVRLDPSRNAGNAGRSAAQ